MDQLRIFTANNRNETMAVYNHSLHNTNHTPIEGINTSSGDYWGSLPQTPYWAHVSVATFMTPVTLLASGGNGMLLYLFIRFQSLRTASNLLLVNLALSDLLTALTGYPLLIIASFNGRWTFGQTGCNFYGASSALLGLGSINSLVVIAVDRYLVIYRNTKLTYCQSILLVIWVWLYSLPWAIAPLLGWCSYTLEAFGTTCSYNYMGSKHHWFLLTVTIGNFILPLLIILYCYCWIIVKFKTHKQEFKSILEQDKGNPTSTFSSSMSSTISYRDWKKPKLIGRHLRGRTLKITLWKKSEYKIARALLIIISMYCISKMPYALVTLIGQYGDRTLVTQMGVMVPIMIAKISTLCNPFILMKAHPRFKSALLKLLPQWLKKYTSNERRRRRKRRQKDDQVVLELDYLNKKANSCGIEGKGSQKKLNRSQRLPVSSQLQVLLHNHIKVSNGEQSIEFHNESQVVEFLIEWVSAMSARQSNDELKVVVGPKASSQTHQFAKESSSFTTENELLTIISTGVTKKGLETPTLGHRSLPKHQGAVKTPGTPILGHHSLPKQPSVKMTRAIGMTS